MPWRLAVLCLAGMLLPPAAEADERAQFRGMSLERAIRVLEARGLAVLYSSALVKPWMRIRDEPQASEPQRALEQMLAPFGLTLRLGPDSMLAIVRGVPPRATAAEIRRVDGATLAAPFGEPVPLEQVVVATSRYELTRSLTASLASLSGTDIEKLPSVGDDTLRALAWLPGAASNGIGARMNIRGGEAEENLIRFDGLRLYAPFHLKDFQSIFSAIDPRIVSAVDVYTGGFSARFGDRMSGVIDITSLAPPAPRYGEVSVSFLNTSALGAGRFAQDEGEWLVAARRGNLDVWYHALSKEPGTPSYADAFAKVSYRFGERLRVTANTLLFADEISLAAEDQDERATAEYSDRYFWVRVDQQPNASLNGTTLLAHTRLRSGRSGITDQSGVAIGELSDQRSFDIASVQSDWSWRRSDSWLVQLGGDLRSARGRYDYRDNVTFALLFDTPGAVSEVSRSHALHLAPARTDYSLYATVRHSLTPRLTSDVGFRWESHTASPRFGIRYELGERTALRAAWSRMVQSQSIDELQVADGVAMFFPPQRTDQTSLALEHQLPNGMELRAEIYDKRQTHLRPRYENLLDPLTLVPELTPDRIRIAPERGRARGAELSLAKAQGPLKWWVTYSASTAREQVGTANVLRGWDQRHALSARMDWSTERWNISAGWIGRSGWPTTAVTLESRDGLPLVAATPRNAHRSARFESLNARVARNYALDHTSLSVFLEVTNVLGRRNTCCTHYEIDDETGDLELERQYSVPLLPSLGFLWQF
jgi:outer membrane cobalamin receptor